MNSHSRFKIIILYHCAAITPLAELCDSALSKKYGINPNKEVMKISTTAMEQKKVSILFGHHEDMQTRFKLFELCVGFTTLTNAIKF